VARIREQVGDEEVILGLSGGVDSSVAAALIHRAIGDQLTCVFVDHGLLRLNEGDLVMEMFAGKLHAKVIRVDASAQFLGHLKGVTDPEPSARSSAASSSRSSRPRRQAQAGPRAPSGWPRAPSTPTWWKAAAPRPRRPPPSRATTTWAACPSTLGLKLLEPLRELFKDEVRELGVALGLPHDMVYRHPFPGPGLGVRILGEVKKEYADAAAPRRRHLHRRAARHIDPPPARAGTT
jgi:GMP synthase (glutamine-hydrolysing)